MLTMLIVMLSEWVFMDARSTAEAVDACHQVVNFCQLPADTHDSSFEALQSLLMGCSLMLMSSGIVAGSQAQNLEPSQAQAESLTCKYVMCYRNL